MYLASDCSPVYTSVHVHVHTKSGIFSKEKKTAAAETYSFCEIKADMFIFQRVVSFTPA